MMEINKRVKLQDKKQSSQLLPKVTRLETLNRVNQSSAFSKKTSSPNISASIFKNTTTNAVLSKTPVTRSPGALRIHPQVPSIKIPPEVLYHNAALTNATAVAMASFNKVAQREREKKELGIGGKLSPLHSIALPRNSSNSVIKLRTLEKSSSRYIRQKRPIPAISTLQQTFNSPSPLRVPNYQGRSLHKEYSEQSFTEDLPKALKMDLLSREDFSPFRLSDRRHLLYQSYKDHSFDIIRHKQRAMKNADLQTVDQVQDQYQDGFRQNQYLKELATYDIPHQQSMEIEEDIENQKLSRSVDASQQFSQLKLKSQQVYEDHAIVDSSYIGSSYSGQNSLVQQMSPLMKGKRKQKGRKATSVKARGKSSARKNLSPGTHRAKKSGYISKEEKKNSYITLKSQKLGLLQMAQQGYLQNQDLVSPQERERQQFYNRALEDLKERLSRSENNEPSSLQPSQSQITLIDQLLQIYRAVQKRRVINSLSSEQSLNSHSRNLQQTYSLFSKGQKQATTQFAKVLRDRTGHSFLRIENSDEQAVSPDLDSDITYPINFGQKTEEFAKGSNRKIIKTIERFNKSPSIPPSPYGSRIDNATPRNRLNYNSESQKSRMWSTSRPQKLPKISSNIRGAEHNRTIGAASVKSSVKKHRYDGRTSVESKKRNELRQMNLSPQSVLSGEHYLPSIAKQIKRPQPSNRKQIIKIPGSSRLTKDFKSEEKAEDGTSQRLVSLEPEEWEGSDREYQEDETSNFIEYQKKRSGQTPDFLGLEQ